MGNVILKLTEHEASRQVRKVSKDPVRYRIVKSRKTRTCKCGLVGCMDCGMSFQVWFVERAKEVLAGCKAVTQVSIVDEKYYLKFHELRETSMTKVIEHYRSLIRRAKLNDRIWIGCGDISLEENDVFEGVGRWSLHVMLLTEDLTVKEKKRLRKYIPKSDVVKIPVHRRKVFHLTGSAAYASKPNFYRDAGNRKRTLNGSRLKNLMIALNGARHENRLLLIGAKRYGYLIHPL